MNDSNDLNNLIDVGQGEQQTFDRVLAFASSGQQELRATTDDRHAVANKLLQHLLQVQLARLAVDQRQENN